MKKFATFIFITWWCVTTAIAGGKLEWVETRHSVDEVMESHGRVTHIFKAINTGNDDVVINRVRASCGCSTAEYPRRPIAPGDTALVTVTFNPVGRVGNFTMFYTVLTDAEPHRTTLRLEGKVKAGEITVNEKYPVGTGSLKLNASSVPFGEMTAGEKQTATIEAYNDSDVPMLLYTEDIPKGLKVSPHKTTVQPRTVTVIKVSLNTEILQLRGYTETNFTLFAEPQETGTGALAGIRHINVMATVHDDFSSWNDEQKRNAPELALNTDRLVFADMDTLSNVCNKKQFVIKNHGNNNLKIYGIHPIDDCITVNLHKKTLGKDETTSVDVTVLPSKTDDNILNTYIIIYCNDPLHYKQMVRIVGNKK